LNGLIRLPEKRSPTLTKNCALVKWKSSGQMLTPSERSSRVRKGLRPRRESDIASIASPRNQPVL
jgi:hypothetical protein